MRTSSSLTLNIPSPLERFTFNEFDQKVPHIDIKRDDLIHGTLSGNKLRKLAGHLSNLQAEQMCGLLTMGGPWSNHLHACGWLCYQLDIPMVALVRGEQPDTLSNMLSDLRNWGIELRFIPFNIQQILDRSTNAVLTERIGSYEIENRVP